MLQSVRLSVQCPCINNDTLYDYSCYGTLIGSAMLEDEHTGQHGQLAKMATELSPVLLQKHSPGGSSINMPPLHWL